MKRFLSHSPRRLLIIASSLLAFAGCTTTHKDFQTYSPAPQKQAATSLKTAIVLPDSLCSFYYDNGNLTAFELGPTICQNARIAAKTVFPQATLYSDLAKAKEAEYDLIGIIRPRAVRTGGTREIPATVYTNVDLTWDARTGDDTRQYSTTLYGRGADRRTYGLADTRYAASMQLCLNDLAANLQQEMSEAYEKTAKSRDATNSIRARIAGFKPGVTTYTEYRNAKNSTWRLFALDEKLDYRGQRYAYLSTPETRTHQSSMGPCTTYWGKQWPILEELRPTRYLNNNTTDKNKLSKLSIKEYVGSVYDNHPLCELVFEGDNTDNAVLTRQSCDKDYTKGDIYTSRDVHHENELSETAQQWLKLRVGMPKNEIEKLAGTPSVIVSTTLFAGTTQEYGHGRIILDGDERLAYWQLRELPSALSPAAKRQAALASGPSVIVQHVVGAPGLGIGRQPISGCLPY
ncbi:MAG: hypothetical protein KKH12_03600 [Gammaproteobacteria bacterium]|nr:hypothetical protein [Gammaproteobacteria bacterium]MBU1480740.1 hypothetical protein [Gammaproteobacteria bacterium]